MANEEISAAVLLTELDAKMSSWRKHLTEESDHLNAEVTEQGAEELKKLLASTAEAEKVEKEAYVAMKSAEGRKESATKALEKRLAEYSKLLKTGIDEDSNLQMLLAEIETQGKALMNYTTILQAKFLRKDDEVSAAIVSRKNGLVEKMKCNLGTESKYRVSQNLWQWLEEHNTEA